MVTAGVRFRDEFVDGESLRVVERDSLAQLHRAVPVSEQYGRSLSLRAAFVERHPEFWLARRVVGPTRFVDWLLVLLTAGGPQRVQLEYPVCVRCGVRSAIANPTVQDLYIGLPNARDAYLRSWTLPVVPCPNCGSPFERNAIWAERVPDDVLPTLAYVRQGRGSS